MKNKNFSREYYELLRKCRTEAKADAQLVCCYMQGTKTNDDNDLEFSKKILSYYEYFLRRRLNELKKYNALDIDEVGSFDDVIFDENKKYADLFEFEFQER